MKCLLLFIGLLSLPVTIKCDINILSEHFGFQDYKQEFNKTYSNEDAEWDGFVNYLTEKIVIDEQHEKFINGLEPFDCAFNRLSDISIEKKQSLNGFTVNETSTVTTKSFISMERGELDVSVDWRTKGLVSPVQDQGFDCSSGWAFAALGALEGQISKKNGYARKLSEQNLVDCNRDTNYGCLGGDMIGAYDYIIENRGVAPSSIYPYKGVEQPCKCNSTRFPYRLTSYVKLTPGDELGLAQAVASVGPIAVAIDASLETFFSYKSGIYYDVNCRSSNINHGVLIVGYGTDVQWGDYWLVKNSWGSSWGEGGYFKIARNRGNHCGIASYIVYPVL